MATIRRPIASLRLDWRGAGFRSRAFTVVDPVLEPRRTNGAGFLLIWAQI